MPIRLPPISRREFLRRSLITGAAALSSPSLLAASRRADPHSWALLGDIHIAADRARAQRDVIMAEHFEKVTADIFALGRRPAGMLVAGDLALNNGEAGDYATLKELVEPIRAAQLPLHLALGNHDHRERFLSVFPDAVAGERPVATHVVSVVRAERVNWILLDSLEQTLSTPGLLGETQLAWLARALDTHHGQPAIVVLHHNPTPTGAGGLKDTQALLDVIRPRREVKACIFGHTHQWQFWTDESGLHCINLPAVAYVFGKDQPSGWAHARLERQGMDLELRSVNPAHPLHGQVVKFPWRKA